MNIRTVATSGLAGALHAQRSVAIALGVGLLVLGLLFQNEVSAAITVWMASTAYNHCFLVIPISAYLLWDRRDTFTFASARPFPLAAIAAIPLLLAWLIAERLGIMEGRQLVAMSFVELLFFTILGPVLWWRIAGPLLYLYFLVPFGAFLTPALQDFTTVFVRHGLAILHIPAYIDGYLIDIPEGTFLIAEACAGLRFLIAATAFGCLYALLIYRSPLRRTLFIIASVIVPIIANGFRALGIVALGHYLGSAQAVEADHVLYGWVFFSIVIMILILVGLPFREDQRPEAPAKPAPVPVTGSGKAALIGTAGLIVLAGVGPAISAQLDRAAALGMAAEPATIAPGRGCWMRPEPLTEGLGAPGHIIVQRVGCGRVVVALTIEVFAPRTTASQLLAELRRLTLLPASDDAVSRPLRVQDAPAGTWRLTETQQPFHLVASSLWVEGQPARGGLAMRARLALNSIAGSRYSPVLVVVTPESDPLATDGDRTKQAERDITTFLQSQPDLFNQIARLAGSDSGRP